MFLLACYPRIYVFSALYARDIFALECSLLYKLHFSGRSFCINHIFLDETYKLISSHSIEIQHRYAGLRAEYCSLERAKLLRICSVRRAFSMEKLRNRAILLCRQNKFHKKLLCRQNSS